jgi:cytochrome c peroxidase
MNNLRSKVNQQRLRLLGALFCVLIAGALFTPSFQAQEPQWSSVTPLGLPADTWSYYVPKNNPLTAAKVELGRKLFFDSRLSADGRVSCANCHKPELAFTDGLMLAEGVEGRRGARNSPTLLNTLFTPNQFWDGRADTLEDQAVQPLINELEMGNESYDAVVARLRRNKEYGAEFRAVFGSEITIAIIGKALAAYERTLVAGAAPFDRFIAGEQNAISDAAKRGFALFRGKGRCARCHTFSERLPFFTDFGYHNTGVAAGHPGFARLAQQAYAVLDGNGERTAIDRLGAQEGGQELGRLLLSYQIFDLGSFRTPSLRNVALTAPYFHDGSAATLRDVVKFYNAGGRPNINREWDLDPLDMSEAEQRDLVAWLETLTGQMPKQSSQR